MTESELRPDTFDAMVLGDNAQLHCAHMRFGVERLLVIGKSVQSQPHVLNWPEQCLRLDWPAGCVRCTLLDARELLALPMPQRLDRLQLALHCARDYVAIGDFDGVVNTSALYAWLDSLGYIDITLLADWDPSARWFLVRIAPAAILPHELKNFIVEKVTLSANLDGVFDGELRGWINDPKADIDGKYHLLLDGVELLRFTASERRTDLARLGLHAARGFRIALPRENFVRADHELAIAAADGQVLIRTLGLVPRNWEGCVDLWDGQCLWGWLADAFDVTAKLDVYLDGILFTRLCADQARTDLTRGAGFVLALPYSPTGSEELTLELRVASDGSSFMPPWRILCGRAGTPGQDQWAGARRSLAPLLSAIGATALPPHWRLATLTSTAIIIPIYNAAKHVRRCIESVLRWTSGPASLILIDDASTDPEIELVLRHYRGRERILVHSNAENLGYTHSVNIGLHLAAGADVVMLNSDTEVGPRWLETLRLAAYSDDNIGTVTAVSDNAGAFTVPEMDRYCPPPACWDSVMSARAVLQHAGLAYPVLPTGNGFCMFVKRAMLDRIGRLDARAFPHGYGEENDLCMRGEQAGFRHIIVGNVLIRHERSASFGHARREELCREGSETLRANYPQYEPAVSATLRSFERQVLEYRVRRIYADHDANYAQYPPRPRILFVAASADGGAAMAVDDLMAALHERYETFLLRWEGDRLCLYRRGNSGIVLEQARALARCREFAPASWHGYERELRIWLVHYAIDLVHIHHLGWHSPRLPDLVAALNIPLIYNFHDFYAICTNVKLLDEQNRYCGGHCTAGEGPCRAEFAEGMPYPPLKHNYVREWKRSMRAWLAPVDAFTAPSMATREVLLDNHSWLAERHFEIIAHGRDFSTSINIDYVPSHPRTDEPLRILVPGQLSIAKGAALIAEIAKLDGGARLDWHFLGVADSCLADIGTHHGPYQRDDFGKHVSAIRPHLALIPSILAESYCYTVDESWAAGLPVAGSPLGAVAERIARTGAGWVLPDLDPAGILATLCTIADDVSGYVLRLAAVSHWRRGEGICQNLSWMSLRYARLYRDCWRRRASFAEHWQEIAIPVLAVSAEAEAGFPQLTALLHYAAAAATADLLRYTAIAMVDTNVLNEVDVVLLPAAALTDVSSEVVQAAQTAHTAGCMLLLVDIVPARLKIVLEQWSGACGLLFTSTEMTVPSDILVCDPDAMPIQNAQSLSAFITAQNAIRKSVSHSHA